MTTYLFPHSAAEFDDEQMLADFLEGELKERGGQYRVVTANRYTSPQDGDLVIFHRAGHFVGEALIERSLRRYEEPQRIANQEYEGEFIFDPRTVRVYANATKFAEVREKSGLKVFPMAIQKINPKDYEAIVGTE